MGSPVVFFPSKTAAPLRLGSTRSNVNMSAKMHEYPGWNKDLRWTDQRSGERRDATYPMGIHYNCHGAESEMLLMREVAIMLVMDRLTDKPDWHVKVFNDEIADKWRQEALAWPNDDLYNRIINVSTWPNMNEDMLSRWFPTKPKDILNKESVDYVCASPPTVFHHSL